MVLKRASKFDRRTETASFKVTKEEKQQIEAETKRRKLKSISEFLAICVFENIGKKV